MPKRAKTKHENNERKNNNEVEENDSLPASRKLLVPQNMIQVFDHAMQRLREKIAATCASRLGTRTFHFEMLRDIPIARI